MQIVANLPDESKRRNRAVQIACENQSGSASIGIGNFQPTSLSYSPTKTISLPLLSKTYARDKNGIADLSWAIERE